MDQLVPPYYEHPWSNGIYLFYYLIILKIKLRSLIRRSLKKLQIMGLIHHGNKSRLHLKL